MSQQFSEDDALIEGFIVTARQYLEDKCNISIGQQEREVVMSTDGDFARFLPSQPMVEVTKVEYTNCDCMLFETPAAGSYSLMGGEFQQFKGQAGYWRITYTCGYVKVPDQVKNVLKALVFSLYEQRGDSSWSVPAWVKEQVKQLSRKSWV